MKSTFNKLAIPAWIIASVLAFAITMEDIKTPLDLICYYTAIFAMTGIVFVYTFRKNISLYRDFNHSIKVGAISSSIWIAMIHIMAQISIAIPNSGITATPYSKLDSIAAVLFLVIVLTILSGATLTVDNFIKTKPNRKSLQERGDSPKPRTSIMTSDPLVNQAAQMAHELNRAYCATIGDPVAPPWDEATPAQKDRMIVGVRFALENPQATPEMMHQNWMKTHLDTGWTYGEVKDEVLKTHPCLVEYDQLPEAQLVKDKFIRAVLECLAPKDPI